MTLETVVGLGILAFLFSYMAFQLDEKHNILKVLMFVFSILLMFIISKVSYEGMTFCEILPVNATMSGVTAHYEYERVCFENTDKSGFAGFKLMNYFVRILNWYIIIIVLLMMFDLFKFKPFEQVKRWFNR